VIVESPAKARTINRYLGPGYLVKACMGHVRDLPSNDLGIDLENDFTPVYTVDPKRRKVVSELAKAAGHADLVYLATDLDREGEAIAWHLATALHLAPERTRRVVFNEITKTAIQQAFAKPHSLDMDKVNAQQARRLLDRIVGYQLSPLLWKKIAKGLSAGRVQSVACRLIVEREAEIRQFVPSEYWRIAGYFTADANQAESLSAEWAEFLASGPDPDAGRTVKERTAWLSDHDAFQAELVKVGGHDFEAKNVQQCLEAAQALGFVCEEIDETVWEEYAAHGLKTVDLNGRTDRAAAPAFRVSDLQTKRTTTKPAAPFITATLQQAASTRLGMSASRTMRVAQNLYEGVDIGNGEGPTGLITYMRTDSTALSADSIAQVRQWIGDQFGDPYLPDKPNAYGSAKRAQEAHEAVRPTNVTLEPSRIKSKLTPEQYRLYDLIWRRFVACQMTPAQWDSTTVLISADTPGGEAVFKASGRRLVFDGFTRVMPGGASDDVTLPELQQDQAVIPLQVEPEQKFTSPPPRYTEASLVKAMEAEGIGRPSTYASIIQTIQDRGYVELIDRRFYATDKGQIVTEKLVQHFPQLMDLKFTSYMEDELDKIEEAHLDWLHVLREFYDPFKELLDKAHAEMEAARAEPSEYRCPKCNSEMVYRWARTGRFLSCTAYPDCTGSYNVDRDGKPLIPKMGDVACEVCGEKMQMRRSRHGPFLGCSAYPECTNTVPCDEQGQPLKLVTEEELEAPCDACGVGTLKVRRSGARAFLGCDKYPECKQTRPLPKDVRLPRKVTPIEDAGVACDRCGRPMLVRTGRRGKFIACSGFPRCRNTKPIEKLEALQSEAAANGTVPPPVSDDHTSNGRAKGRVGSPARSRRTAVPKGADGKVDLAALGPPPPGFAWTRTGKPVVETWPEDTLHCPDCGSEMTAKAGRFGPFFSCTNFPKCRCSVNLRGEAKKRGEQEFPAPQRPKPIPTDVPCDECGEPMLIRSGRSGRFLGCSKFPKCKFTKPLPEELTALATAGGK